MADPEHAAAAAAEASERVGEEHEVAAAAEGAGEEEDTGAQVAPIVRLEEVAVTTGEEDEEVLYDQKAKLYRFDKDGNQWKERGAGTVKLLKHKSTGKVRLVMRQAKTLKICANHLVIATLSVHEHAGNDKSCVWHATDFSDGELKDEMFCMRFGSVENCKSFMETIEKITASLGKNEEQENKEVDAAAEVLGNLNVGGGDANNDADKRASEEAAPPQTNPPAAEQEKP
ncbi:hypothetical protein QJS04_geneDACA006076 [Acorus gramineus]|uniref:RanBD1 domain-containing protein n=1 Tax=Acorus gramineus TaxID=55184 RepID=A0AAV9B2K4_ACOGR|nr:hypothetical protein QJS04_geneDACA006076 [Acorus gramineus]